MVEKSIGFEKNTTCAIVIWWKTIILSTYVNKEQKNQTVAWNLEQREN